MNEFEKEYYEYDPLWNIDSIKKDDLCRVNYVINLIPQDVNTVLDVGSGNGLFCNRLKMSNNKYIVGLDRSFTALKYVYVDKVNADISKLPFKDNSFDLVVTMEVLEHLPIPIFSAALKELSRVSNKYILISVPNDENLKLSLVQCPYCFTAFNPVYHMRSFNKSNLTEIINFQGFKVLRVLEINKNYVIIFNINNLLKKIIGFNKDIGLSICPTCGFNKRYNINNDKKPLYYTNIITTIKKIWPKKSKYRWLIALYIKN